MRLLLCDLGYRVESLGGRCLFSCRSRLRLPNLGFVVAASGHISWCLEGCRLQNQGLLNL